MRQGAVVLLAILFVVGFTASLYGQGLPGQYRGPGKGPGGGDGNNPGNGGGFEPPPSGGGGVPAPEPGAPPDGGDDSGGGGDGDGGGGGGSGDGPGSGGGDDKDDPKDDPPDDKDPPGPGSGDGSGSGDAPPSPQPKDPDDTPSKPGERGDGGSSGGKDDSPSDKDDEKGGEESGGDSGDSDDEDSDDPEGEDGDDDLEKPDGKPGRAGGSDDLERPSPGEGGGPHSGNRPGNDRPRDDPPPPPPGEESPPGEGPPPEHMPPQDEPPADEPPADEPPADEPPPVESPPGGEPGEAPPEERPPENEGPPPGGGGEDGPPDGGRPPRDNPDSPKHKRPGDRDGPKDRPGRDGGDQGDKPDNPPPPPPPPPPPAEKSPPSREPDAEAPAEEPPADPPAERPDEGTDGNPGADPEDDGSEPADEPPAEPAGPRVPPGLSPPSGPAGGGIARPSGPGGRRRAGYKGFDRWEYWWEYNKDRFLARRIDTVTYGAGPRAARQERMAKMREEILLPALRKASTDRRTVIRAAALMALGKVGDFESFQVLFRGTADRDKDVRKAALLGLSYLGTTEVTLVLERTLLDEREDTQVRAFAAGSLGLVTAPGSSAVLVWATDERRPVDVRGAAILALGFYEDEHSRKALVDLYRNTRDDPRIRSMAIGSLGRRGEVENVKTLIAALRDKKVDVRRAAALGLGAIQYMGKAEQWLAMAREARLAWNERHELTPEARKSLEETIERFEALAKAEDTKYRRIRKSAARRLTAATEKESDLQTRAFALISLAEIGSTECITPIRKILARKSHRLLGWAGIAAGVSGDKSLVPYLRKGFLRAGTDPSNRAAMALGLGMLEEHSVAGDLGRVARDPGADPDLRGYSITALALMPHRSILSVIDDVLATKGNPSLHRNAALALGVAGRAGSGKRLVALMDGTNDLYVKAAATIGLGYLREPTSAQVLADAASNRDIPFLARLYGVLAVGYLGDRQSAPPTLSRLAWFYNYRVSIPAVDRLTSLL